MPPARRLARYKGSKTKKKKGSFTKWLFVFGVIVLVSLSSLFFVKPKKFTDDGKFSFVVNGEESVSVITFDPDLGDITKITIPAITEIDSARNLGKFKLGNIWKLGENEKIGGKLLQESIVKNFGFPVTAWAASEALALTHGNFFQRITSAFSSYETNLSFGDKIKIAMFSLKNSKTKEIDLSKTTFLKKTNLIDGEVGYTITKSIPTNLVLIFSDNDVAKKQFKVVVRNASDSGSSVIPLTIELTGAKIASELKENTSEVFCVVNSVEKTFAKKIAEVFGCSLKLSKPEGNFDLEIFIGEEFSSVY